MIKNELNDIAIKPIKELKGFEFLVPDYQRGYRWEKEQIVDLLDDIEEFHKKETANEIYCLQPLVVKSHEEKERKLLKEIQNPKRTTTLDKVQELLNEKRLWRVVDGQQRLTTIYLILHFLNEKAFYSINYETREKSTEFLQGELDKNPDYNKNIDFYYMYNAYKYIDEWFSANEHKDTPRDAFKNTLLEKVSFIWYTISENENSVFKRLNIGKIPLTNSELIKALFLNNNNFKNDDEILKIKIALERDSIESQLQNDEFWYFIHNGEETQQSSSTRIDFIFDIISKNEGKNKKKKDNYSTFRFYKKKINNNNLKQEWQNIKNVFQTLKEWFDDIELFHYVGYLVTVDESEDLISKLIEYWSKNCRDDFLGSPDKEQSVKGRIYKIIEKLLDFDKEYDDEEGTEKRKCKPLLLLHNIETIVRQNNYLKNNSKYRLPNFTKFPFHLYKKETWDVEHIFPNSGENLKDNTAKENYLKINKKYFEKENNEKAKEIRDKINKCLNDKKNDDGGFSDVYGSITTYYDATFKQADINKIKNFTLLDSSTNRGISNSIFPLKRKYIINKEKGTNNKEDVELKYTNNPSNISFIPPCTKNVFTKFYTPYPDNLSSRSETDANYYQEDIIKMLDVYVKYNKDNSKG